MSADDARTDLAASRLPWTTNESGERYPKGAIRLDHLLALRQEARVRSVDQAVSERDTYRVRDRLGGELCPQRLDLLVDGGGLGAPKPGYVGAVEAVREIAEDLSLGRREFVAVRDSAFREVAGKDTFDHDPMMP